MKKWGIALTILGCVMLLYWFSYDTSVAIHPEYERNGFPIRSERVVNLGLMNDRLIGIIVSLAVGGAGLGMLIATRNDPNPVQQLRYPAPTPPPGFNCNLQMAIHYQPQNIGHPSTSKPIWMRNLAMFVNLQNYKQQQIDWAYQMNVPPKDFATFIAFIESYRHWQNSQGKRI